MLHKIYAVWDDKLHRFVLPRFFETDEDALREFRLGCNNKKSKFFVNAEDYSTFEIGSFDDTTGRLETLKQPRQALTAMVASVEHRQHYASHSMEGVPSNGDDEVDDKQPLSNVG